MTVQLVMLPIVVVVVVVKYVEMKEHFVNSWKNLKDKHLNK
jgi:hypothetical protein